MCEGRVVVSELEERFGAEGLGGATYRGMQGTQTERGELTRGWPGRAYAARQR